MILDLGHTPVEAHSGAEALELLSSGLKVDVVLTDHAMPSMTGLQLAEFIHTRFPGLPIILATGYAELPDRSCHFGNCQAGQAVHATRDSGGHSPRGARGRRAEVEWHCREAPLRLCSDEVLHLRGGRHRRLPGRGIGAVGSRCDASSRAARTLRPFAHGV